MNGKILASAALSFALLSTGAQAEVSAEQAKQLGSTLTPWGAEAGANKDGTIPAYVPNSVKVPASYDPSKPAYRPDPFADDKVLYSVTAANVSQYADKLSEGFKAMFARHPDFRIDVYPTRRSVSYPPHVVENTLKNATVCKTVNDGLKVEGCYGGLPFPIPTTGAQVMWNHLLRYNGYATESRFGSFFVDPSGSVILQGANVVKQSYPFYDPKRTEPSTGDDIYWTYLHEVQEPARKAGERLLIVDYVDNLDPGRKVWQYLPGQRRVKLSPDLAYDTPNPQSGGSATMDDATLFMGALDRYDFELVGKREMLIPYNNYKLANGGCPSATLLLKGFFNPDCIRWELHRVWVAEAKLKPGSRHVYARRTFYFDEDAPGAGVVDNYDAAGKLYRVVAGYPYALYEADGMNSDPTSVYDLQTGAYATFGNPSDWGGVINKPEGFPAKTFTADSLAGTGIR